VEHSLLIEDHTSFRQTLALDGGRDLR
jgi:hypothetical protein